MPLQVLTKQRLGRSIWQSVEASTGLHNAPSKLQDRELSNRSLALSV